jgi:Xaa-Pro aminopeptidase
MTLAGSEDTPYLPLVESGEHIWMHYRFPTDRRIRPGDMIWIDCGACIINGYNGDIGRTTVVGKPTQMQKDIYRCIYDMLQAGTEKLRVGVETPEVAKAINEVPKKRGWGDHVYYGICGHGIGTDLHEAPDIGELVAGGSEPAVLMENEVICLEPGISLPKLGGGHVENMILITKDGPEPLTKTPYEDWLL